MRPIYDSEFYGRISGPAQRSAGVLAPHLVSWFSPTSAVDVGCGSGAFLAELRRLGVESVLGIDGNYVSEHDRLIEPSEFLAADLTDPPRLDRRFDLVLTLEVAEHLERAHADRFVRWLTELGDVIVFSAAIPGQGGVHHVNEQWPAYWSAHFATLGWRPVDALRPVLWSEPDVAWWYAQNTIVYVPIGHPFGRDDAPTSLPLAADGTPLPLVHPTLLDAWVARPGGTAPPSLRAALRSVPSAARRAASRRLPSPRR